MLPFLTIIFILGIALGSYLQYFPLSIGLFFFASTIAAVLAERRGLLTAGHSSLRLACLFCGCLYWSLFSWSTSHVPVPDRPAALPSTIDGTIVESVRHAPGRLTALMQVTATDDPDLATPFSLRLTWRDPDRDLQRGLHIRLRTRVHAPSGTLNPRGFDYAAYLEAQGVDAVGSVSGAGAIEVLGADEGLLAYPISSRIDAWRSQVRNAADALPQPARGLFLSLTIGEQGFLAPEVREWFMTTGTVHILSISGSHLGLIALLSFALVRKACLLLPSMLLLGLSRWLIPSRLAALLTLVPVLGYTLLAGAETATIRSAIMIIVGLWTIWLGTPQYLLHALAAAAGLTLLVHPAALYDISFQLSYVSVWVLALALQRQQSIDELPLPQKSLAGRTFYWLQESIRLTAWVTLATLPLVACYFNQVSWMGIFANLLMVPFVGFILLPISLLSAVWVIVSHSSTLPGAGLIELLAQAVTVPTQWLAGLPGAEWFVAAPTVPLMALFYLLGWAMLTDRPAHAPLLVKRAMAFGMACLILWWLWSPRPFTREGQVRITFLDVGQGDSAVIELPKGEVVLIDGGATYERFDMGRSVVAPFLWNRGIRTIDHVIATHPQLDHAGGLAWILAHVQVENFWTNGVTRSEEFWRKIERTLARRHLQAQVAEQGRRLVDDAECDIAVLNPPPGRNASSAGKQQSLNNLSVVTELTCGGRRMLFTGDIEREGLARMVQSGHLRHIDLLKVPHHGALSSLDREWLSSVQPDIAVVSAGRRNPYGHPAGEVIAAYESLETQLWRTDQDGAVWADLDLNKQSLTMHSTREWQLQPALIPIPQWAIEQDNFHRLWRRWNWN
ncbi:MAG TPA: DNA internalization-related competence protein ComEC/Rec2 [Nitrospira sp.]|nr:DNA internalization-related competence protein ComEC/Rec2 [Nitrospira sp.]